MTKQEEIRFKLTDLLLEIDGKFYKAVATDIPVMGEWTTVLGLKEIVEPLIKGGQYASKK